MRKCRDLMNPSTHVKHLLALFILHAGSLRADDAPDPREILETVRIAQSAQEIILKGRLRTGNQKIPFTLAASRGAIRWQFADPPQTLILSLGDEDSRLEEISADGARKVSLARFDDKIRGTDICYEDLAMRFLYWRDAVVQGEQTMVLQKCWIVRVAPPSRGASQYSQVKLWIAQDSGALMQAEAYDRAGQLARRFKVVSGQKTPDGRWILKQMRIEGLGGRSKDRTPTYLEIEKPA